jgi:RNA polymerase sigma factor for flagellar operon FliA
MCNDTSRVERSPTMQHHDPEARRPTGDTSTGALASSATGRSDVGGGTSAAHGSDPTLERAPPSACDHCLSCRSASRDVVCDGVIRSYLPLVHQVVHKVARRLPANVLRDDLLAAGVFGLVDSLRRNGGDQGDAFEAYARIRIRGAVLDELRAQDWLPRRARTAVTLAESDGGAAIAFVSIDDLTSVTGLLELPAANENPYEALEAHLERAALVRALEKLPERERHIVGMHYFPGVKFKEIGASLGVSVPRISQLHARALDRLRALIHDAA